MTSNLKENNMGKIKLVVDSMSLIDLMKDKLDADVLRALVNFDGKEYVDGTDLSPEKLYKMMAAKPGVLPKTSQPTIGTTVETYEKAKKAGYTDVIVITMSDGLSGTYANTVSAKDMVKGINVHIVNSKNGGWIEYQLAKQAKAMIDAGSSAAEIVKQLEKIKKEYKIYMVVGDLNLLHKGGRLSTVKFAVGQLLKVKPILTVGAETGSIEAAGKGRTVNGAVDVLLETIATKYPKITELAILHSDAPELAESVRERLLKARKNLPSIEVYGLVSTIGAHVGLGTVAITFRTV
jgi:DegV family protein with EDD domain